jgi:hypothetical protein
MPGRRILRWLAPVAAVAVAGTAFAPWTVSGYAVRHSFATVRSARLLGLGDHAVVTALLGAWYFVPALAAGAGLAAVLGRDRLAGVLAAAVGGAAVGAALVVWRAPVGTGVGVPLALAAGVVAALAGLALAVGDRPRR